METNTNLTILSLGSNNIGAAGATALATALETNTTLTALYLYSNNINDTGTAALASALQNNTTLMTLNLGIYPAPAAKLPLLQRNRDLWRHTYWSYVRHEGFSTSCRAMVVTSFLCGNVYPDRLPLRLWRTIFSFWKRQDFFLIEPNYQDE